MRILQTSSQINRHPSRRVRTYITNALGHIGGSLHPDGYSPGTLTAAVIFSPLSLWIFLTCFGRGRLRYPGLAAILLASILAQAVLLGLLLGLSSGSIHSPWRSRCKPSTRSFC